MLVYSSKWRGVLISAECFVLWCNAFPEYESQGEVEHVISTWRHDDKGYHDGAGGNSTAQKKNPAILRGVSKTIICTVLVIITFVIIFTSTFDSEYETLTKQSNSVSVDDLEKHTVKSYSCACLQQNAKLRYSPALDFSGQTLPSNTDPLFRPILPCNTTKAEATIDIHIPTFDHFLPKGCSFLYDLNQATHNSQNTGGCPGTNFDHVFSLCLVMKFALTSLAQPLCGAAPQGPLTTNSIKSWDAQIRSTIKQGAISFKEDVFGAGEVLLLDWSGLGLPDLAVGDLKSASFLDAFCVLRKSADPVALAEKAEQIFEEEDDDMLVHILLQLHAKAAVDNLLDRSAVQVKTSVGQLLSACKPQHCTIVAKKTLERLLGEMGISLAVSIVLVTGVINGCSRILLLWWLHLGGGADSTLDESTSCSWLCVVDALRCTPRNTTTCERWRNRCACKRLKPFCCTEFNECFFGRKLMLEAKDHSHTDQGLPRRRLSTRGEETTNPLQ